MAEIRKWLDANAREPVTDEEMAELERNIRDEVIAGPTLDRALNWLHNRRASRGSRPPAHRQVARGTRPMARATVIRAADAQCLAILTRLVGAEVALPERGRRWELHTLQAVEFVRGWGWNGHTRAEVMTAFNDTVQPEHRFSDPDVFASTVERAEKRIATMRRRYLGRSKGASAA